MLYIIDSEGGKEKVEAHDEWAAASCWAASRSGFDSEDVYWDGFSFTVTDESGRTTTFYTEVCSLTQCQEGRIKGIILVSNEAEDRYFDERGVAVAGFVGYRKSEKE